MYEIKAKCKTDSVRNNFLAAQLLFGTCDSNETVLFSFVCCLFKELLVNCCEDHRTLLDKSSVLFIVFFKSTLLFSRYV